MDEALQMLRKSVASVASAASVTEKQESEAGGFF